MSTRQTYCCRKSTVETVEKLQYENLEKSIEIASKILADDAIFSTEINLENFNRVQKIKAAL